MPKTNKLFLYNKKIDNQARRAAEKVLGFHVRSIKKMKHGEVNHVYKVITEKATYLLRIFKYKNTPENGNLSWIEKQLTKKNIPHAKILYYSRKRMFFPYGFMVTEFLEGWNGAEAVKLGKISLANAFLEIGKILKKVHTIKIKKFGNLSEGKGEESNYIKFKLKQVKYRINRLTKDNLIPAGLYPIAENKIKTALGPFRQKFLPVLNHGDANRENGIYSQVRGWVLVDWDNAYGGIWLEDYAELTFWTDFNRTKKEAEKRHLLVRNNFFKGYGKPGYTTRQITDIEKVLHIMKCTNMMIYYYYTKRNFKEFKIMKRKFLGLLE